MTDPIADMLTRIRNAYKVNKATVDIPHSNLKQAIANLLVNQGYLDSVQVLPTDPQKTIRVTLRYVNSKPVITKVIRISKPGRRVYQSAKELKPILSGHGISILSTSQGIITDSQARQQNIGGEIICQIW